MRLLLYSHSLALMLLKKTFSDGDTTLYQSYPQVISSNYPQLSSNSPQVGNFNNKDSKTIHIHVLQHEK